MNNSANSTQYYGEEYFEWQKQIGEFSALADKFKFVGEICAADRVIDFGCGGGYMLASLTCAEKIGVEVNPVAREQCGLLGIKAVPSLEEIEDDWADVIISHHALEHVHDPFGAIKLASKKLKSGGKIIFVVPCESYRTRYRRGNVDNHLYTWSPVNIGNLFNEAGYRVEFSERIVHRWTPRPYLVQRAFGWKGFDILSRLNGFLRPRLSQVKIVAIKP
ncbi:class I SAM-dependent methyltransferase [Methylobacterium phyllosphaerae]